MSIDIDWSWQVSMNANLKIFRNSHPFLPDDAIIQAEGSGPLHQ